MWAAECLVVSEQDVGALNGLSQVEKNVLPLPEFVAPAGVSK
jgi:hypothetical protein